MKLLYTSLLLALAAPFFAQTLPQYRAVLLLAEPKDGKLPVELAIRSFKQDSQSVFLLVQPDSLSTRIAPARNFNTTATNWDYLNQYWTLKPYLKALRAAWQNDAPLQDAGITHTTDPEPGIALTADLCPSHLPLDRRVFTALLQTRERDVPIALSVSGVWIQNHKDDLAWLKTLARKGALNIVWTNHTLHHNWDKNLRLNENFLLEHGTDLPTEVLGNEELMLKNGLVPSCFFRFPGLVSDKAINDQILAWGLIPIGSDAWLAKAQHPQAAGSIVLIHANGNEPLGVEDFFRLLKAEKPALARGRWRLLDLREEIGKE